MIELSKVESTYINGGNCIESADPAVTRFSSFGCAIGRAIGNTLEWLNPFK